MVINKEKCFCCGKFLGKKEHKCSSWKKEEISFLKENYGKIPTKEISEKLNKKIYSIRYKANKLGISIMKKRKWEKSEISFLIENHEKLSYKDIAEKLNRNRGSVSKKTEELRLKEVLNIKKNKIFTEEHRKNMNKGRIGIPLSLLVREKISKTEKKLYKEGKKIIWNKGKSSWNKNIGDYVTGEKNPFYGKNHSKENIDKMKERRKNIIFPLIDSSIEIKIQEFLKELKIEFFTHQFMHIEHGYQCDIFIPSMNLVIECDGDYWHGNPLRNKELTERQIAQREKDNLRKKELEEKGFKVLRLWECEIRKMEVSKFKEILNEI